MSARETRALDRFLVALDRLVLGTFFRQIELVGIENVPAEGPLLIVSNHGNSLVDPMLIFGYLPRVPRFLAKSTLWQHPAAKYLVRLAAAIPVYRRQDPGVDTTKNVEMFARTHEELAAGGVIALFPEGTSHSEPALAPLKTGVARIALGAEAAHGPLGTVILPVGLNFEDPEAFRSRVLVLVGRGFPVVAPAQPTGEAPDDEVDQEEVRALTERVDEALRGVTLSYESWRQAELLDLAAQVYSRAAAEAPTRAPLSQQFALKKRFLDGYRRFAVEDPALVEPVLMATERYDRLLREVGLEDRHVAATYPPALVARFLLERLWTLTLWRPLSLIGVVLNWLPYRIPGWVVRSPKLEADVKATYKVLLSMGLFPLFWILETVVVGLWLGWSWGLATLLAAPATGYLALTYNESWKALRDETRAFLKLRGRRATVGELRQRRQEVAREVARLVERGSTSQAS